MPLGLVFALCGVGCTVYPEHKNPTLGTTTSAEQHERILWQMAAKQQLDKIQPLLAENLIWNVPGKSLRRDEVGPYLQTLNLKDAVVRDVIVKPNGPDMTVAYTLEISTSNAAAQDFSALSVWQETKGGGWILIAHSQQLVVACAALP